MLLVIMASVAPEGKWVELNVVGYVEGLTREVGDMEDWEKERGRVVAGLL